MEYQSLARLRFTDRLLCKKTILPSVFTLFGSPQIDRSPITPSFLCGRCVYQDFQYRLSSSPPCFFSPAKERSWFILAKHLNPDEVKLHPFRLATLCLSRHIACSGVSLKSRLWPKLRCTLTRGSIGLDPKLPLTSREKNLKRIPT